MNAEPRPTTDRRLRELVSQHAARRLGAPIASYPVQDELVEPAGMTLGEEAELELLLEMADASLDGDEQAAIERLVAVLGGAPRP